MRPLRPTLAALSLAVLLAAPPTAQSLPPWAAPTKVGPVAPPPAPQAMAPPDAPSGPLNQVPVDGGLGLLALAGAGYAARRLRRA